MYNDRTCSILNFVAKPKALSWLRRRKKNPSYSWNIDHDSNPNPSGFKARCQNPRYVNLGKIPMAHEGIRVGSGHTASLHGGKVDPRGERGDVASCAGGFSSRAMSIFGTGWASTRATRPLGIVRSPCTSLLLIYRAFWLIRVKLLNHFSNGYLCFLFRPRK